MRGIIFGGTLLFAGIAAGESLWVEGEDANRKSVNPHSWYDSVNKEELSGGGWISNFAKGDDRIGTAEYDVKIPVAGSYALWLRANLVATKLSLKIGKDDWTEVNTEDGWSGRINIAADGKLDLRFVAWKKVGIFELKKGPLPISFRMDSDNHNHGAIDCFVLTTELWKPEGTLKPGESAPEPDLDTDDDGSTWAFRYGGDTLRAGSPIDLRRLNEKTAGERGFLTRTKDGTGFAFGDGSPARIWAVGSGAGSLSDDDMARNARFLAKLGVNMVRFHGSFSPREKGAKLSEINRKEIDRCQRLVAAMKKEGIYTTISPFWGHAGHSGAQASWGLDGYDDGQDVWGLLFFNDEMKAAYKGWMRELYTKPNPHTGIPLAKDSAVGLIQIHNEDSLLFYTMQGIKPPQKAILDAKFSAWLERKHGSLKAALRSWDGHSAKGDDIGAGRLTVMIVWEMTQQRTGGHKRRLDDQTQFLGELQRGFYQEIHDFYRNELGCKQLINACNWKSADEAKLGDLERWTYEPCEVIAVNRYYNGGPHAGPDNGWRINPGDFFSCGSAIHNPLALPTAIKQNAGKPMIITESTLMMAYQALTGIDAFYWFNHDGVEYQFEPYHSYSKVNGQYGMHKWKLPPAIETMFPATALAYRMGYIDQAEPVLAETRKLEDLWQRNIPKIAEGARFDPNRDKSFQEGKVAGTSADPSLFLRGPVVVGFEGGPPAGSTSGSRQADPSGKITTKQVTLDPKAGLCTLNAPKVQGATGFLGKAGQVKLSSLIIDSKNDYTTVLAVSLDGKPLESSNRILIQCGTKMRPSGWKTEAANKDGKSGERVVSTGRMPWRSDLNQTTLLLKNPSVSKATTLDTAGFPREETELERSGSAVKLPFPGDAIWVVLE